MLGQLVILTQVIGQPGIGIGHDQRVGLARQRGEMRAQQVRTERAVEADGERLDVPHRMPERLDRMARKIAPGHVGDGHAEHDRHLAAGGFRRIARGHGGGLGVERVEDRLDQDEIDPALDQRIALFAVHVAHRVEIDLAIARIVDIGRERERLVGRTDRAGDKARLAVAGLGRIGFLARDAGGFDVDLAHQMLGAIIGLADAVGAERVGLDDVRPGVEIGAVDAGDDRRAGQRENVVIALLVVGEFAATAEIGFFQPVRLDLRAIAAVEHHDALRGDGLELF